MRRAYFATNAFIVLVLNGLVALLHVFDVFPYFYTLFYPLFCFFPLLMAGVGWIKRDQLKWPAMVVTCLAAVMLGHWIYELLWRMGIV